MSNYTPGPWEASHDIGANCVATITSGWVVVSIGADPNKFDAKEDAQLIAAAPEMLDDLQYRYEQNRCGCRHPACKSCDDDQNTLKVLRKAKGETE